MPPNSPEEAPRSPHPPAAASRQPQAASRKPPAASRTLPLLLLILALALALRLFHISRMSLWLDESLGILFSRKSGPGFWHLIRLDVHPPLYFLILRLLDAIWGSPLFFRLFSVICGTAALAVFYAALSRRADSSARLLSLLFLAASPVCIHYSQEIRMYALLLLFAMIALWAVLRFAERPEWPPFLLFCLAGGAMVYTHYFSWVFLAGCLVYLFWERIVAGEGRLHALACSLRTGLVIVIFYLPWLGVFQEHLASSAFGGRHSQGHLGTMSRTLIEYFTQLFGGVMPWVPLEKTVLFRSDPYHLGSLGWWIFFIFVAVIFVRGLILMKRADRLFRPVLSILGTGFILTMLHLAFRGRFYSRCFIIYLPLVFYVTARGIVGINGRILRATAVIYLSLCLLVPSLLYLSMDIRDVTRPLALRLKEAAGPSEPIVHTGKFSYFPLKVVFPERRQYLVDTASLLLQERTLAGEDLIEKTALPDLGEPYWLIVEYWGRPAAWDEESFWIHILEEKGHQCTPVFSRRMGVKTCTLLQIGGQTLSKYNEFP